MIKNDLRKLLSNYLEKNPLRKNDKIVRLLFISLAVNDDPIDDFHIINTFYSESIKKEDLTYELLFATLARMFGEKNTSQVIEAIDLLIQEDIFYSLNFKAILPSNSVSVARALCMLNGAGILTRNARLDIKMNAFPEDIANSYCQINQEGFFSPANCNAIINHQRPHQLSNILTKLRLTKILNQSNFNTLLDKANSWFFSSEAESILWNIITEPFYTLITQAIFDDLVRCAQESKPFNQVWQYINNLFDANTDLLPMTRPSMYPAPPKKLAISSNDKINKLSPSERVEQYIYQIKDSSTPFSQDRSIQDAVPEATITEAGAEKQHTESTATQNTMEPSLPPKTIDYIRSQLSSVGLDTPKNIMGTAQNYFEFRQLLWISGAIKLLKNRYILDQKNLEFINGSTSPIDSALALCQLDTDKILIPENTAVIAHFFLSDISSGAVCLCKLHHAGILNQTTRMIIEKYGESYTSLDDLLIAMIKLEAAGVLTQENFETISGDCLNEGWYQFAWDPIPIADDLCDSYNLIDSNALDLEKAFSILEESRLATDENKIAVTQHKYPITLAYGLLILEQFEIQSAEHKADLFDSEDPGSLAYVYHFLDLVGMLTPKNKILVKNYSHSKQLDLEHSNLEGLYLALNELVSNSTNIHALNQENFEAILTHEDPSEIADILAGLVVCDSLTPEIRESVKKQTHLSEFRPILKALYNAEIANESNISTVLEATNAVLLSEVVLELVWDRTTGLSKTQLTQPVFDQLVIYAKHEDAEQHIRAYICDLHLIPSFQILSEAGISLDEYKLRIESDIENPRRFNQILNVLVNAGRLSHANLTLLLDKENVWLLSDEAEKILWDQNSQYYGLPYTLITQPVFEKLVTLARVDSPVDRIDPTGNATHYFDTEVSIIQGVSALQETTPSKTSADRASPSEKSAETNLHSSHDPKTVKLSDSDERVKHHFKPNTYRSGMRYRSTLFKGLQSTACKLTEVPYSTDNPDTLTVLRYNASASKDLLMAFSGALDLAHRWDENLEEDLIFYRSRRKYDPTEIKHLIGYGIVRLLFPDIVSHDLNQSMVNFDTLPLRAKIALLHTTLSAPEIQIINYVKDTVKQVDSAYHGQYRLKKTTLVQMLLDARKCWIQHIPSALDTLEKLSSYCEVHHISEEKVALWSQQFSEKIPTALNAAPPDLEPYSGSDYSGEGSDTEVDLDEVSKEYLQRPR